MIRRRTDPEVEVKERHGFTAFVLTDRTEVPELSAVDVDVHGAHDKERIERGTRAYMVMEGSGKFIVDDKEVEVGPGTYVVIRVGQIFI